MDREIIALHIMLDQGQCQDLFSINAIDMQIYYFLLDLPFIRWMRAEYYMLFHW